MQRVRAGENPPAQPGKEPAHGVRRGGHWPDSAEKLLVQGEQSRDEDDSMLLDLALGAALLLTVSGE